MEIEEKKKISEIWINKAKSIGYVAAANLMSELYPVDFETYMIAFELCDNEGNSLDYFTFPIMPTELNIEEETPVKVENTFGGVNTISSSVFVPKTITLNGNFGRQFKILIRNKAVIPFFNKVIQERNYGENNVQKTEIEISNSLKTGFGTFKILQSIINRAVEVNNGECNKLYMYNLAYGENYLVKPISFKGSQNINNNGIWDYSLTLKAVCPLYLDSHKKGKLFIPYNMSFSQSALNIVLKEFKETLNRN